MRASSFLLLAVLALETGAADFVDTAEVISSTPIVERVKESRQECGPAKEAGKKPECRTVTTEREYLNGYLVVYRYNGRDIATKMPSDPGATVQVGIGVIDAAPRARKPPSANSLGSNVREVVQPEKPPSPAPAPAQGNPGGYQYRY